jgi:hypothetical protein
MCVMPDSRTLNSVHSDLSQAPSPAGSWLVKLPTPVPADRLTDLNADLIGRPSRRRRVVLAAARFAATFCIGVAATLAWLPYGDAAREMIANSSQQFGWLAPQAGVGMIFFPSPGQGQHNSAASDLDAVQERIDRIASNQEQVTRTVAQLAASEGRIAQEITKIREVEEYLLYKTSYKAAEAKIADPLPRPPVPLPPHKPPRRPQIAIAQH